MLLLEREKKSKFTRVTFIGHLTFEKWDLSNFGGWKNCYFQVRAVGGRLGGCCEGSSATRS